MIQFLYSLRTNFFTKNISLLRFFLLLLLLCWSSLTSSYGARLHQRAIYTFYLFHFGTFTRIHSVCRRSIVPNVVCRSSLPSDVLWLTDLSDDMRTYFKTHTHSSSSSNSKKQTKISRLRRRLNVVSSLTVKCYSERFSYVFSFCVWV